MKKQLLSVCAIAAMLFTAKTTIAQYAAPISILEVPALKGATIDGDADAGYTEWQACKIAKRAGAGINPYEDGDATDFGPRFKAAWDKDYLYIIGDIIDDTEEDYLNGAANPWTWDNSEVFIDLDTNGTTATYSGNSTVQLRFCRGLLSDGSDDSLVESPGRTSAADYMFKVDDGATIDNGTGWHFEVAIPWTAATDSATYDIMPKSVEGGGTVVGFDIGFADADGDGSGTEGGRNVEGGAQAFWDLDDPVGTGNEDNAYQDRRVFGFISLTGVPTGIETAKTSTVGVYPNPATTSVTFSNLQQGASSAQIISLLGQTVKSLDIANNKLTVDISDLPSGVYFFKTDKSQEMTKFVVK